MRIVWQNDRFEAILTPGAEWQADMASAKAAGFKTEGPPAWVWASYKALPLVSLKENRPPSGLTISREALEKFQAMLPEEEKNAALLATLKETKKKLKKVWDAREQEAELPEYWKKGEFGKEDLPPEIIAQCNQKTEFKRPDPPKERCIECGDPVYPFEMSDIPRCLWCEKESEIILDKMFVL